MAYTQTATTSALLDTVRGNNSLVNDLAKRRLYDTAVEEFNARDRRPKVNFSKVISEEQTLIATRAYPEFQITFYNTQNAVHSLAGGLRSLELEYLMMQIPYGSLTYDIGGNFASHLFKGRAYVHCCMPNLDVRDIMRHEGQKDSIELYLSRLERGGKTVPNFQKEAFDRYAEIPEDAVCHNTFQTCEHQPMQQSGRVYAIALHSIYDIPADEFGAALLRKNVHTCYAAFHFSENLLLEDSYVNLDEINACFSRDGDKLTFSFASESTLNYCHSYSNILKYVCKTYFPASNREVYMKEFLVTRVNTWFCKFSRIDTFLLYKGVAHKSVDSEQFYTAMEDAWHYKKTLAMCNSERILLEDSSSVNYWFPKMRDMVIVPLFDISLETSKRTRKEVLVSKDFVFTVLNHIRTYQAKALTYANVLSFVESIRSRVIINGVTARSEWDVDKSLLQSLSMTFYLHTKLAVLKDDLLISKFSLGSKTVCQHVWDEISLAFGNAFPSVKERLLNRKLISVAGDALEIRVPDLYVTFHDRLVTEYKASVDMPALDIRKKMEETEVMYNALSELSVLRESDKFDVDVFSQMCQSLEVDPMTAAKVIVAVMSNESGLTLTFERPTEANVALALQDQEKASEGALVVTSREVEEPSMKGSMARGELQLAGLAGDHPESSYSRNEEIESLEQFHMATADSLIRKQMSSIVYTGPIKVQQMKNFIDSLVASLSAAVSNLVKILKDTAAIDLETRQKFGVLDVASRKWLIKPTAKSHAWGVVETHARKYHVALLEYDEQGVVTCDDWRRVAVSSESVVYSDMAKLRTLRRLLQNGEPHVSSAKVVLVDGVPGCGKTKEILSRVNFDEDLILVPGKQAAEMIRRRANSSGIIVATKDNVKTVDSFMMNFGKSTRCQFKRLFIDEGLMLHTGCVNFLVAMSLCEIAYVYGDTQQIPYINRVSGFPYPAHFAKLEVDEVETRRTTLRCPADVTHYLNRRYEGFVMSTSSVKKSVSQEMVGGAAVINPISKPLHGKILTFTQSDKEALLSRGYSDVHTVHEVQGETYSDVSLVRLTPTPVSIIAGDSPHVLVALSRHTCSLKYYTVVMDPLVSIIRDLEKLSSYLLDMYKVDAGTQ
uniref:Replication protein n=1 Tax=Tobacco mosaic virus TaxID=12242 RepID=I2HAS6_9VIRU|nr:replication protein [Tobacco mosaic virus]